LTFTEPPTTCNSLISNGDFSSCTNASTCDWYHIGNEIKLVSDPNTGNKLLSTVKRPKYSDGFVQYLDTRCMIPNEKYTVQAIYKLVHSSNNSIFVCNPSDRLDLACARSSLRMLKDGVFSDLDQGVARTVVQSAFLDGWNRLYGHFSTDSDLVEADSVLLQIDGAPPDVDILLDDVSITPKEPILASYPGNIFSCINCHF